MIHLPIDWNVFGGEDLVDTEGLGRSRLGGRPPLNPWPVIDKVFKQLVINQNSSVSDSLNYSMDPNQTKKSSGVVGI